MKGESKGSLSCMYIHRGAKLIYLAHRRTASLATRSALLTVGFEACGSHHGELWKCPHTPITPENWGDWTVITTVRNHWDTIISWMFNGLHHTKQPIWTVDDIQHHLDLPRGDFNIGNSLWDWHGKDADVIWRFETLPYDMENTLTEHGIATPWIPQVNVSSRKEGRPYQSFYTPETREYVGTRFKEEIDKFGYKFEE